MRLTLRTLLAYIDEILEPDDQRELAEKIETSDFAADLLHRTKDAMRRLRLSAPQPLGSGLGLDPNTVAEYLDNTLAPESVADLERICLESDVHLAEAAACHHILTMVLGQPAEIDPELRARMYDISAEAERRMQQLADASAVAAEPVAAVPAPEATGTTVLPPPPPKAADVEVPDYLRASRSSALTSLAKWLAVAAVFAGAAYLGWRQWQPQPAEVVAAVNGPPAAVTDDLAPPPLPPPVAPADSQPAPPAASGPDSTDVDPDEPSGPMPVPIAAAAPAVGPVEQPVDDPTPQSPPDVEPAATPDAPTRIAADGASDEPANIPPTIVPSEQPQPVADESPAETAVAVADPAEDAAAPTEDGPTDSAATEDETTEEGAAPPEPVGPVALGTFFAERNVLLRFDESQEAWMPLPAGSVLESGSRLLSLPTFRPNIALHSRIGVLLSGATLVELDTAGFAEDGRPITQLELVYGRVVLQNVGEPGNPVNLIVGDAEKTVRLGAGARLAIEAERQWIPGRDPLTDAVPVDATVYAPAGDVTVETADGLIEVAEPARWNVTPQTEVELQPYASPIAWLDEEPAERLELLAAEQLRTRLQPGVSAAIKLLELSDNRRKEVRALATRSGAYVGQFVPFVRELRDSEQRLSWNGHIETLRKALALSPESAARVRETLVDQLGTEAADDLFEMLRGYSLDDIGSNANARQAGALDRLINFLESDQLEYRVLAAYNLREITGKNLMQNPAANPGDRAQAVRRWRQRLAAGELAPQPGYGG